MKQYKVPNINVVHITILKLKQKYILVIEMYIIVIVFLGTNSGYS